MNTPSPPPVYNPGQVASQQQASNIGTAQAQAALNNVSQVTPLGNLTYTQGPNGTYTATTTLSPQEQQLFDILQGTQGAAGAAGQNLMNASAGMYSGAPNINPSSAINQAVGMEQQYLNPYFQQQNSQLQSQLANQGFAVGSQAYNNAVNNLNNQQGNLVAGNIAQFEPMAYNQALQSYQLPLQTAQQLASFGAPGSPNFVNTPQTGVSPTNVTGAYANAQNALEQNYQAQVAQQSAMMGGLFGLGAAGLGAIGKYGLPTLPSSSFLSNGLNF